jgi:hypothetical protein
MNDRNKHPLLSRVPKVPGELRALWARGGEAGAGGDVCYVWGDGVSGCDSRLLHYWLTVGRFDAVTRTIERSFQEELEDRGYDLKTLKFSIRKRETEGSDA